MLPGCSQDLDLNRDFPDRFSSPTMQPSGGEQPEVAAMMAWSQSVGFVASASMHEVRWEGVPAGGVGGREAAWLCCLVHLNPT